FCSHAFTQSATFNPKCTKQDRRTSKYKKMPIAPPLGVGIQCELRPFGQSASHIKSSQSRVFTLSELET
ncbi:MAG: hypothetical protein WCR46_26360, partial [Deltaproteobacteria bacterium]